MAQRKHGRAGLGVSVSLSILLSKFFPFLLFCPPSSSPVSLPSPFPLNLSLPLLWREYLTNQQNTKRWEYATLPMLHMGLR